MNLYSWGSAKSSALGCNSPNDIWEPSNNHFTSHEELAGLNFTSLAAGERHTLLVTSGGEVFSFGKNNFGQCGMKLGCKTPQKIVALQNENIVQAFASGDSSFVLTDTGKVYRFGLIHVAKNKSETEDLNEFSSLGRMTGMASDQDIQVQVDIEARGGNYTDYESRQLSTVIEQSSTSWMIADSANDYDYFKELRDMGYTKEDTQNLIDERGREYHGMLQIGCQREPSFTPSLIRSPLIDKLFITSVGVGHAHFILLSKCGRLFSAGYNDRGQLGLGHRIGTKELKQIKELENKFVLQIACGQQHSMCRVANRSDCSGDPDSSLAGDVYVWGNGILGQLGLGRIGTSKGRLYPTLVTGLYKLHPKSIIDISCGDNFSLALTEDGKIYSWGHSEYNQHGGRTHASSDYVDTYHYFVPRVLNNISQVLMPGEIAKSIKCGANFSIAKTSHGNLISWGWYIGGVLGRGNGLITSQPTVIPTLGNGMEDKIVDIFATGSHHVICSTKTDTNEWARTQTIGLLNPEILKSSADVEIYIESVAEPLFAHSFVLSGRCNYFRGFLDQARKHSTTSSSPSAENENGGQKLVIEFSASKGLNCNSMKMLLVYLYSDRINVPIHRRSDLKLVADLFGLNKLKNLCSMASNQQSQQSQQSPFISTFESDIQSTFNNEIHYPDVFFYSSSAQGSDNLNDHHGKYLICAHKCVLGYFMSYFHALFYGEFSKINQNKRDVWICIDNFLDDGIDLNILTKLIRYAYSGNPSPCNLYGKEEEKSVSITNFTGLEKLSAEEVDEKMKLLIAANRFGFSSYIQLNEKKLLSYARDDLENIQVLKDFAISYNFPVLEKKCELYLSLS